ncbi:hypothetical protein CPC08DRAFT_770903 [Agrocybe pediades]|nr:hypothetical protein CPC08DRAFT_770903 [Agrocybe pediades]
MRAFLFYPSTSFRPLASFFLPKSNWASASLSVSLSRSENPVPWLAAAPSYRALCSSVTSLVIIIETASNWDPSYPLALSKLALASTIIICHVLWLWGWFKSSICSMLSGRGGGKGDVSTAIWSSVWRMVNDLARMNKRRVISRMVGCSVVTDAYADWAVVTASASVEPETEEGTMCCLFLFVSSVVVESSSVRQWQRILFLDCEHVFILSRNNDEGQYQQEEKEEGSPSCPSMIGALSIPCDITWGDGDGFGEDEEESGIEDDMVDPSLLTPTQTCPSPPPATALNQKAKKEKYVAPSSSSPPGLRPWLRDRIHPLQR